MANNTSNNCELDLVTLLEYNQELELAPGSNRHPFAVGPPQRPTPTGLHSGQWVGIVNQEHVELLEQAPFCIEQMQAVPNCTTG